MLRISLLTLLATLGSNAGEKRQWTNPEGTKSFEAEYLSSSGNEITLKRTDGKVMTFDISKLHQDDHHWLKTNRPPAGNGATDEMPDDDAIFDKLKFGDSREKVLELLDESTIVEAELEETLFGRTGLDGSYRTHKKVGGLYCYLFYEWDAAGNLRELTLRTEPQPESAYDTTVRACWEALPELISLLHGRPTLTGAMPASGNLEDGGMQGSHIWNIEGGGKVMLGIAKVEGKYEVAVRFTLDEIKLVPMP